MQGVVALGHRHGFWEGINEQHAHLWGGGRSISHSQMQGQQPLYTQVINTMRRVSVAVMFALGDWRSWPPRAIVPEARPQYATGWARSSSSHSEVLCCRARPPESKV